jgi:transposase-like protein
LTNQPEQHRQKAGEGYATMKVEKHEKEVASMVCFERLEEFARSSAQTWIATVFEEEVTAFLGRTKSQRRTEQTPEGSRNGYGRSRKLAMMNGTIEVRRPRVRDVEEKFESKVLPLFCRKTGEVSQLLPELYLHGLSSGDFELAMRGLLGDGAPLSASSIERLRAKWKLEYAEWENRDLSGLDIVYAWADGLYVKAGIEDRKTALLVIVGATTTGEKVLLGLVPGERESKESWLRLLRGLVARGLVLPTAFVADGHLGLWSALGEIHPKAKEQRCWNHKITNVLDRVAKKAQPEAKEILRAMMYAETKAKCEAEKERFSVRFLKSDAGAVTTLERDWERMTTYYSFPKEHWVHLRTTNIIESPFAAVRLRTDASKRFKKVDGALAMIWKLLGVAEKNWRKLNAPDLLSEVRKGVQFVDGVRVVTKNEEKNRLAA